MLIYPAGHKIGFVADCPQLIIITIFYNISRLISTDFPAVYDVLLNAITDIYMQICQLHIPRKREYLAKKHLRIGFINKIVIVMNKPNHFCLALRFYL